MAVTQRRNRASDGDGGERRSTGESGIKVTCDLCHVEVTNTVRFKCADPECGAFDICPNCFCEGKEGQRHKAWHAYKVEEELSIPIFTEDWGADEELLLVSGLISNGLGNWPEVAAHVGTRTKEECERHYLDAYLGAKPLSADGINLLDNEQAASRVVEGATEVKVLREEFEKGDEGRKRKHEFMPLEVDPEEFQTRKKARIEEMRKPQGMLLIVGSGIGYPPYKSQTGIPAHNVALPPPSGPLVSAPTNHEIAGFMPGRLEFEHEVENEAEMAVKDMEFGLIWKYGGDQQPEAAVTKPTGGDEEDEDSDEDEDGDEEGKKHGGAGEGRESQSGNTDQAAENAEAGPSNQGDGKEKKKSSKSKGKGKAKEEPVIEIEDEDELEIKLALLDIYMSKLDKREEAKDLIFDRGLTFDYKKRMANEKKRAKDEQELVNRHKVFAKLQTAQDFEVFVEGLIFEQNLRRRIAELQEYRRMGITTPAEAEAYEAAKLSRHGYKALTAPRERERLEPIVTGARANAGQHRFLHGIAGTPPSAIDKYGRDGTPKNHAPMSRKQATPLNLANAQSLDLLTSDEQSLCSHLRVMPKPYLMIKEMYIRENERRSGGLKRRDARQMHKIDVNKSGKIFDFLVASGLLRLAYDPAARPLVNSALNGTKDVDGIPNGHIISQQNYNRPGLAEVHLSNGGMNGVR